MRHVSQAAVGRMELECFLWSSDVLSRAVSLLSPHPSILGATATNPTPRIPE